MTLTENGLTFGRDVIFCHMAALPDPDPLSPDDARRAFREIIEHGEVQYSGHALSEMAADKLETSDCMNVLRAGKVEPPELINGTWRYRVSTQRMCLVVSFSSNTRLRIVTAWRK